MSRERQAGAPIRVTHVTTVPVSLRFLRGQAAFMADHGVELRVVSSPGDELDAFSEEEGVPAHAVSMPRRITPGADLVSLARLWLHFRETRPDVVHSHTPKGGLLGTIAATLAGVPVRIYHMRGLPLMGASGWRRALLTTTERVSCGLASEVFCVSHSLRDVALELDLVSRTGSRVLAGGSGQGVDTRRFDITRLGPDTRTRVRERLEIPESAVLFGFVGRIVRDKGIHELAEAWASVRQALPRAHLLLVGPREPMDPIDPDVWSRLAADERVRTLGFTEDTERLYAAMDVVVLPTYREGFPNVPLEAASMGLPVVATRIPGCVDAVAEDRTGTLVPAREAAPLADAMLRYGRDPELRAAHGRAGRTRVEREFRPEVIWSAIQERYEALIGGRARSRTRPRAEVPRG